MEKENPLEQLARLAGEWATEMTHRLLPGTVIRGQSTFELLEGGKFLLHRDRVDHPEFPGSSLAVIGGADDHDLRMHYFDSRGVVRILELTIDGRVWTFVRDKPDFSRLDFHQRLTWTLSEDGRTISGLGEMSQDGEIWQDDIHITYRLQG
jgi:hypothetical protein